MSERAELLDALRAADAAGDVPAAQAIARRIQTLQEGPATPQEAPGAAGVGGSPAQAPTMVPEGFLKADGTSDLLDRVRLGTANVGIKGYLGVKQLFGPLTEEEQQVLKMSDSDVENSGFAGKFANMAGNVGGGVALSMATPAVPGMALLGKGGTYLKAALASGGMAAATTPIENQDEIAKGKALEALKAGAMGVAATGVGEGIKKGATGLFRATKDAMDLMEQGVNPTLQQAASGKFGRFVGGLTSGFTDVRRRQEQEVLDALTERASNGQVHMPDATLNERIAALKAGVDTDYRGVMKKKLFPLTNSIRDDVLDQADQIKKSGGRFLLEQNRARGILDNIIGTNTNPTRLRDATLRGDYIDRIDEAIKDTNSTLVNDALTKAKNVLVSRSRNSVLTPEELAHIADIDARAYDVMRLKDAATGRAGQGLGVNVGKLADSYGNGPGMDVIGATNRTNDELIGPLVRTIGSTPRQDESRTLFNTARRIAAPLALGGTAAAAGAGAPFLAAAAPLYALSAAGQSAKGARFLTGQTSGQKALKAALESDPVQGQYVANLLRSLRDNTSTIGAGFTPGQ